MYGMMQGFATRGGFSGRGFCDPGYFGGYHHGFMYGPFGGMMELGFILIVLGVIFLIYNKMKKQGAAKATLEQDPALEALKMRFVMGEIEEAEYLAKRDLLKK